MVAKHESLSIQVQYRAIDRIISILVVLFTLYLGVTGSLIELTDLTTIARQPAPSDPNLMAMREDFAGPPNFRVLGVADHVARPLPADLNLTAALPRLLEHARPLLNLAPITFVEFRMVGSLPVGQVRSGEKTWRFDAVTGQTLGLAPSDLNEDVPPVAFRNTVKHLHRMTTFGN